MIFLLLFLLNLIAVVNINFLLRNKQFAVSEFWFEFVHLQAHGTYINFVYIKWLGIFRIILNIIHAGVVLSFLYIVVCSLFSLLIMRNVLKALICLLVFLNQVLIICSFFKNLALHSLTYDVLTKGSLLHSRIFLLSNFHLIVQLISCSYSLIRSVNLRDILGIVNWSKWLYLCWLLSRQVLSLFWLSKIFDNSWAKISDCFVDPSLLFH